MKKSIIIGLVGVLFLTAGEFDIPTLGTGRISRNIIIGDFDNDGNDDVFVETKPDDSNQYSRYGIYSFAKKQYLIELSRNSNYYNSYNDYTIKWANLDGDAGVEVLYEGRIYSYTGGTTTQSVK